MYFAVTVIIKKGRQYKGGKERFTPYQSKDTGPTIPTYKKKDRGKTVEDKKGACSLGQLKCIDHALKTCQSNSIEYMVSMIVPLRQ